MTDENTPKDPLDPGEDRPAGEPASADAEPQTEPTETLEPARGRRRRLVRSRDDRMLAGVAGGIGSYFAVDPVIVRIGFAISVFFGGLGALAYLALLLFVPVGDENGEPIDDAPIESSRWLAIGAGIGLVVIALSWGLFDGDFIFGFGDGWFVFPGLFLLAVVAIAYFSINRPERSGEPRERSRGRSILAVAAGIVIAIFALSALGMLALASAWAGATGHGVAIGGAVVAIGILLALSAFRGHGARWLIIPAVALATPLAVVSAADIEFGDGIGKREYTPSAIATLPADGYELGIGQLIVDLRELDWSEDTELDLGVDLGIGRAIVAVPENVCVAANLDVTAGELDVAGSESEGVDAELDTPTGSPPRLDLTGEVDLGVFRVINDADVDLEDLDHGRNRFHDDNDRPDELPSDSVLDDRMDAACAAAGSDEDEQGGASGNTPGPANDGPGAPADPSAPGREAEEADGTSEVK